MHHKKSRHQANSLDGFIPTQRKPLGETPRPGERLRCRETAQRSPRQPENFRPQHSQNVPRVPEQGAGRRGNFPEFNSYASQHAQQQSAANTAEAPAAGSTSEGKKRRFGRRRRQQAAQDQPGGAKRKWKKGLKYAAASVAALLLISAGWLGWKLYQNSSEALGNGNIIGFLHSTPLKGEDRGRVNIMIAGVSSDDPGHQGANLTDSIMLVSLDTRHHKATLLSIPRDLWVQIPGYGHAKINTANVFGNRNHFSQSGYPSGGMGLLEETIHQELKIPVDYYAKINYSAFRDTVNAVGGIKVKIHSSDPRGLFDPNINKHDGGPLRLSNGVHKLDGQTALNLARARGDPCGCGRVAYGFAHSDFTRTQHQRQMLVAVKQKIASPSVIANPLKLGKLFDALGDNVKTDFHPSELRRLYDLTKQIGNKAITSANLNKLNGKNLLKGYTSPDGESALIPQAGYDNFQQIDLQLNRLLSNNPVVKEAAKVVVLNGGHITGLASHESNVLTGKGLSVQGVGNARHQYAHTKIINQSNGKKPATLKALKKRYGTTVTTQSDPSYPHANFVIILGQDRTKQQ
jgi:LCP family protein required for cell wall assembly